jgi:nucleotide-binding universal stress UspA family protein
MRVLLGVDGSTPSTVAQHLIESIAWPASTTIRVVSVVVSPLGLFAAAAPGAYLSPDTLAEIEDARVAHAHRVVRAAEHALKERRLVVETAVRHGAAAPELLDDAIAWNADLLVVGSHGHGALAGLLLGSVSAELVDHAPCPILIARRPVATSVLVAVDGSTAAGQALSTLAAWPSRSLPVVAVNVMPVPDPVGSATMPGMQAGLDLGRKRLAEGLAAHAEGLVGSAVTTLRAAGMTATSRVLQGHPAERIIAAAAEANADLIVVGSRGLTGLARMRLGSTARGVLHTALVSVLVVPAHATASPDHRH